MIPGTRLALPIMAVVWLNAPARAQTYDPAYPVCMQIYGPVGYMDCSYASLQQCKVLAVGRSAMCLANPSFRPAKPAARAARHHHLKVDRP